VATNRGVVVVVRGGGVGVVREVRRREKTGLHII